MGHVTDTTLMRVYLRVYVGI